MPAEWATTQCNLANALLILGSPGSAERLQEAVVAFTEALKIQTKEQMPSDWAMTTCDRANALLGLGQLGDESALQQALQSLNESIVTVNRKSFPSLWAKMKNTQGAVLLALGQRGEEASLRAAIVAFREGLGELSTNGGAAESVALSNNLGQALMALANRGDHSALNEAIAILRKAMESLGDAEFGVRRAREIESLAQRVFDQLSQLAPRHKMVDGSGLAAPIAWPEARPATSEASRVSRILVVEDDPVQQLIIGQMLKQVLANTDVQLVSRGEQALSALEAGRWDLLILDLHLPDMSGQEVLACVKASNPQLPVLIYSADLQWIESMRERQTTFPDPRVVLLPKDRNREAFIRLVPTLFKRRQRDRGSRLFEARPAEQAH